MKKPTLGSHRGTNCWFTARLVMFTLRLSLPTVFIFS